MKRNLGFYLIICVTIGSVGLYLSYGYFTTASWFWGFGSFRVNTEFLNKGGHLEFMRLLLISILFYLANTIFFSKQSKKYWTGKAKPFKFYSSLYASDSPKLKAFCLLSFLVLVIYHLCVAPIALYRQLCGGSVSSVFSNITHNFSEFFWPYWLYGIYSFVVYMLLVIPMFIVVCEEILSDRKEIKSGTRSLEIKEGLDKDSGGIWKNPAETAQRLNTVFIDVRKFLIELSDKYIFMFALLFLYFFVEIKFKMRYTLAPVAFHILKYAFWAYVIVILPYFVVKILKSYSKAYRDITSSLKKLVENGQPKASFEDKKYINGVREKMIEKYNFQSFLFRIVKTGGLVALVFALTIGLSVKYILSKGIRQTKPVLETVLFWPANKIVCSGIDILIIAAGEDESGEDSESGLWGKRPYPDKDVVEWPQGSGDSIFEQSCGGPD